MEHLLGTGLLCAKILTGMTLWIPHKHPLGTVLESASIAVEGTEASFCKEPLAL